MPDKVPVVERIRTVPLIEVHDKIDELTVLLGPILGPDYVKYHTKKKPTKSFKALKLRIKTRLEVLAQRLTD